MESGWRLGLGGDNVVITYRGLDVVVVKDEMWWVYDVVLIWEVGEEMIGSNVRVYGMDNDDDDDDKKFQQPQHHHHHHHPPLQPNSFQKNPPQPPPTHMDTTTPPILKHEIAVQDPSMFMDTIITNTSPKSPTILPHYPQTLSNPPHHHPSPPHPLHPRPKHQIIR